MSKSNTEKKTGKEKIRLNHENNKLYSSITTEYISGETFKKCYPYSTGTIGIVVWGLLSIIPRTITFWNEKEVVIDDIKNWISTSNIMRYILRNINNKFNIFSLPIASTNITLSESIFSLLSSSLTFLIVIIAEPDVVARLIDKIKKPKVITTKKRIYSKQKKDKDLYIQNKNLF